MCMDRSIDRIDRLTTITTHQSLPTPFPPKECKVISESEHGVVAFAADKSLAPGQPKWANYVKARSPLSVRFWL